VINSETLSLKNDGLSGANKRGRVMIFVYGIQYVFMLVKH